jgi:hypothetical protein
MAVQKVTHLGVPRRLSLPGSPQNVLTGTNTYGHNFGTGYLLHKAGSRLLLSPDVIARLVPVTVHHAIILI